MWGARDSLPDAQGWIRDPVRDPDLHAGFHSGPGVSYGTWRAKRGSMRCPGPRMGYGVPCGIQCGIRAMLCPALHPSLKAHIPTRSLLPA